MDIFSIFCNTKVCYLFSLESPHRGNSKEYIQHTIINIKDLRSPGCIPNTIMSAATGFFVRDSITSFEIAMVNEPSVFKLLIVVVVMLFYVHGKHLRLCRDGQLT